MLKLSVPSGVTKWGNNHSTVLTSSGVAAGMTSENSGYTISVIFVMVTSPTFHFIAYPPVMSCYVSCLSAGSEKLSKHGQAMRVVCSLPDELIARSVSSAGSVIPGMRSMPKQGRTGDHHD